MDIHNLLLEETVSENNTPPYVGKIKNTKKSRSLKYTYQGLLTYLLDLYSNLLLLGITAKLWCQTTVLSILSGVVGIWDY